jgi:hypothetical protein
MKKDKFLIPVVDVIIRDAVTNEVIRTGKAFTEWDMKCYSCEHRQKCELEYGKIGVDEEDCRAIAGTHFCLKSWEDIKNFDNNKTT